MPELKILLFANAIFFVAFFVRSLTGFGAGLIAIPLLAIVWDLSFLVPMQLLFEIGISLLLLPRVFKDIHLGHVRLLAVGMFIGNMTGANVLKHFDNTLLKLLLAAIVFAFGLLHGLGFASVLADFGLPQSAIG